MAKRNHTRSWIVQYYTRVATTKAQVPGGQGTLTIEPNGKAIVQDETGREITKGVWYGEVSDSELVIGDKILKIIGRGEGNSSQKYTSQQPHTSRRNKKAKPAHEEIETETGRQEREKLEVEQKEWEASIAPYLEEQRRHKEAEQAELQRIEGLSPKSKIRAKLLRHKFRDEWKTR